MRFYATIYFKNGEIHLKCFDSREAAERCIESVRNSKYGEQIDNAKVVRKDPNSPSFLQCKGYWIS